jgi:uncharacterized RDD family membrane protein YckC
MGIDAAFSYASWGRRLVAVAIDVVLLSIAPFVVLVAIYILEVENEENLYAMLDWLVFGLMLAVALAVVSAALYFTLCVGRNGQTVGKRMVGVAVRDAQDPGRRIGYWRALTRCFVMAILWAFWAVPAIIDSLWPLFDKRRQTWHDKVARSVVVRV